MLPDASINIWPQILSPVGAQVMQGNDNLGAPTGVEVGLICGRCPHTRNLQGNPATTTNGIHRENENPGESSQIYQVSTDPTPEATVLGALAGPEGAADRTGAKKSRVPRPPSAAPSGSRPVSPGG